ncbi:MAG TPA: ferrous iron transport protein B [Planctomycetaceae bacterium]|nr:ferrous iron transport protein B [Planctomycetaceae bacterium]
MAKNSGAGPGGWQAAVTDSGTAVSTIRPWRVALIGNPNTGKSTLFNALSGLRVRTGNYPGVTVEQRIGRVVWGGREVDLVDLPGTYSLAPRSPDEMVAVQVLTGVSGEPAPDLVICICNAAALERNLYLATQVLESGVPVILCLNMWDAAEAAGLRIDSEALSAGLGVPVVCTSASRREGLERLQEVATERLRAGLSGQCGVRDVLSVEIRREVVSLLSGLRSTGTVSLSAAEFLASRALLDPGGSVEQLLISREGADLSQRLQAARERLRGSGIEIPSTEARQRYHFIGRLLQTVQRRVPGKAGQLTDRLDAVLTHSVAGLAICLGVLLLLFSTIYWFTAPLSDGVEGLLGVLADAVSSSMSPGPFRSLLTDGVIAGVGAVLVFLPQICLLFLFIGLLEDCGYMARAAWMMDRLMSVMGLSGRSFLPLMSSFACAVPGIMATRVIENRRDRFVTILIAPLMSCSARLPVYVLMIGTFIPDQMLLGGLLPLRALVLFLMSILGLVVAVPLAFVLRRTAFRGESSGFLLELPDYRVPALRVVLLRVWESGWSFVSRAGTLIFAASVLVWAAGSFPVRSPERYELAARLEALAADNAVMDGAVPGETERTVEELEGRLRQLNAEQLESSLLGLAGRAVEPIFRPLGWDWRIGVGVLASFPAREVVIATLGTIYSLGGDVDEGDEGLRGALRAAVWPDGRPVYTIPVALSVMVFFALCAQCVSTLMVIRRETNSWRWPVACFVWMTGLAWLGGFAVYQVGNLF